MFLWNTTQLPNQEMDKEGCNSKSTVDNNIKNIETLGIPIVGYINFNFSPSLESPSIAPKTVINDNKIPNGIPKSN